MRCSLGPRSRTVPELSGCCNALLQRWNVERRMGTTLPSACVPLSLLHSVGAVCICKEAALCRLENASGCSLPAALCKLSCAAIETESCVVSSQPISCRTDSCECRSALCSSALLCWGCSQYAAVKYAAAEACFTRKSRCAGCCGDTCAWRRSALGRALLGSPSVRTSLQARTTEIASDESGASTADTMHRCKMLSCNLHRCNWRHASRKMSTCKVRIPS